MYADDSYFMVVDGRPSNYRESTGFFFFCSKGRKDFKIGVKAGVKDCIGICYR